MELTAVDVDRYVAAYRTAEPFYPVEQEAIETLPHAFRSGEYGKRDAEWVVRWYFRRYVGSYPHDERRAVEERFAKVDRRTIKNAIEGAADEIDAVREQLDTVTADTASDPTGSAAKIGTENRETEFFDATPIGSVRIGAAMNALAVLTDLPAVDAAVGSAFLTFLDPERYLPMDDRLWAVTGALTELEGAYPTPVTIPAYGRFLEALAPLHARRDVDARTLYMALWRAWNDLDEERASYGC